MRYVKFIILFFFAPMAFSQSPTSVQALVDLGRDSLVNMAADKLRSMENMSEFQPSDYSIVRAFIEDENVSVMFGRRIVFVPYNYSGIYSITVSLSDGSASYSPYKNPNSAAVERVTTLYKSGDQEKDAIELIYKGRSVPQGAEITILENPEYYDVFEKWSSQAVFYKVNKATGEVFDETYEELVPDPEGETAGIEIIR